MISLVEWCPPKVHAFYTRYIRRVGYFGNYRSWREALANSRGYDDPLILEKTLRAIQKVRVGEAVAERDSWTFQTPLYNWPLLTALYQVALRNRGHLRVLDFGGALGSVYFQQRALLSSLASLNWCVVEQPHFVACGQEYLKDDVLSFCYNIDECLKSGKPDLVLFSSVLPYLETPYDVLDEVMAAQIETIVIDRTPVWDGEDRITVQRADPRIYRGSYPAWIFSRNKLLTTLAGNYDLEFEFESLAGRIPLGGAWAQDMGFVFRRSGRGMRVSH